MTLSLLLCIFQIPLLAFENSSKSSIIPSMYFHVLLFTKTYYLLVALKMGLSLYLNDPLTLPKSFTVSPNSVQRHTYYVTFQSFQPKTRQYFFKLSKDKRSQNK